MNWEEEIETYQQYLLLQKGLSKNSVVAYIVDLKKLTSFLTESGIETTPEQINIQHLRQFLESLNNNGISPRTQARIVSGVKSFYKFLMIEEKIEKDPTAQLSAPKIGRKLPDVLSIDEINDILNNIDTTRADGRRNKAIIETLYSCGLRVTELCELKLSNVFFDKGYIRVEGKGNKERLVPLGQHAINQIQEYINERRNMKNISPKSADILFLNRLGGRLSRVMIFNIIKDVVAGAGINKNVSPHTFRHSFATHLVNAGANLRAVQEMLGHESIATTEIYTHLNTKHLQDAIALHPANKSDNNDNN